MKAKDAHSRCINGTLRIEEVKDIVINLWSELYSSFQEDSEEWRIVDKARKEHTDWWSVPTMSNYVKPDDAHNINVIIQTIEIITGKNIKRSVAKQTKAVIKKNEKPKNIWPIIKKHWDTYKLTVVLLMLLSIIVTVILHFDNKSEGANHEYKQSKAISNESTH
ncbi:MAG: hypothetical protein AB2827_11535 [Candidatus Thiodiazotropha sp.]